MSANGAFTTLNSFYPRRASPAPWSPGRAPASLATFETSREDLEDGHDHEPSIGGAYCNSLIDAEEDTADDEPDHDDEYDYRHAPYVLSPEVPS